MDPALQSFVNAGAGMAVPVENGGRGKRQKRASIACVELDAQSTAARVRALANEVEEMPPELADLTLSGSPAASRANSPTNDQDSPLLGQQSRCRNAIEALLTDAGTRIPTAAIISALKGRFEEKTIRNNLNAALKACGYDETVLEFEYLWAAYYAGPPPPITGHPTREEQRQMDIWYNAFTGGELRETGRMRTKYMNTARTRYEKQACEHPWVKTRPRLHMAQFKYSVREAFFCDCVDAYASSWEQRLGSVTIATCDICQETRPSFMTTLRAFDLDTIVAEAEAKHLKTRRREVGEGEARHRVPVPLFEDPQMRAMAMAKLSPCDGKQACDRCRTPSFTELQVGVLKFSAANRALLPQTHEPEAAVAFADALRSAHAAAADGAKPDEQMARQQQREQQRKCIEAERAARTVFDDAWPEEIALVRMAVPCIEIKALKQGGTVSKTHSVRAQ